MEICNAPTLWLKALNMHNITHIMHIEIQNVISNLTKLMKTLVRTVSSRDGGKEY